MHGFEQIMQQMAQMTEEERVKTIESKRELRICGSFPACTECDGAKLKEG